MCFVGSIHSFILARSSASRVRQNSREGQYKIFSRFVAGSLGRWLLRSSRAPCLQCKTVNQREHGLEDLPCAVASLLQKERRWGRMSEPLFL